jgi:dephospho-CoA kinase
MQIVFIAGQAGVGKTTAANIIAAEAFKKGMIPVLESFAGPIKREAESKGYSKEEYPEKYRKYCQDAGKVIREGNADHWVDLMRERIHSIKNEEIVDLEKGRDFWERIIIIDDCRYMNEVGLGLEQNATLLFLSPGKRKLTKAKWRTHESEDMAKKIDSCDKDYAGIFNYVLNNDSTIKVLSKKLKEFVPLWCGLRTAGDEDCDCIGCQAKRNGTFVEAMDLFTELMDLLEFEIDEEYDEEDEETS